MKFKNIIVGLLLTIGILCAQEQNLQTTNNETSIKNNTITWHVIHWPPFMSIENGVKKGEYSQLLNIIKKDLPQYEHEEKTMSWARVWHKIKYGKNTCNIFAFKNPEREKFATFTVPFSIFSSNHIIMKKNKAESLGIDITKPYSFKKLIHLKSVKGILDKSRSYSLEIDTILENNQNKSNFKKQSITAQRLLKLLKLGRIDYILEYPSVVNNLTRNNNLEEKFVSILIKEINPFTWGYIACPKNKWGEELVEKLDNIILSNKEKNEYRKIIEMMTSSEDELILMRKIYPEFIKNR